MQILLEKNVACTMRDGTILYADIYRPHEKGEYPVLLTRLPYSKDSPYYSHRYLDTNRLVESGYVVIIQDVRGRFQSEGEFEPFIYEAEDGYETVEWAAELPYSSGKVGMFGLSYYGFTQLLAATERPPSLHAIFPAQTLSDQRNGNFYYNGAYGLGLSETWVLESIVPDLIKRKYKDPDSYDMAMKKLAESIDHIEEWYVHAPIKDWPPLKELGVAEYFFEQLERGLQDEDWQKSSIANKYSQINVPAYHLGGWYDSLLGSTLENYVEMKEKADERKIKEDQKLIIGPWAHGDFGSLIGDRKFGSHASEDWIDYKEDLTQLHLRWSDYWLKGKDTQIMDEAPVKIFVMGVNQWRDEQEWPLARTNYVPYYLHSQGDANSSDSDGTLSTAKPDREPADNYVYNPKKPVPTNGGGTLYDGVNTTGPRDQRNIEERDDVLVYTSEPLEKPLEVTGPVKVKLWASTDAEDTDFTAKLIDVLPDGTAYNLADGIVRAKYRNGYKPEAQLNGEVVEYEIDLWATSNVFLTGHQIRIEVSSSNFPRFDANLNTGQTMMNSTESKLANQMVYHNKEWPSHIILPVITKDE
ncbi:CocE/NonD family hydrolase [Halobacillus shinanisalinarum]|uniref:CocE/NonD family hydrolase n=1 Tax=Halobacillus shinanisalinarum TaxID=2932258 RepID=A0ABY4H4F0_9BACI|nr:CocE/NonD family hydrolase [Halobacillus shinanisalinarum]UOQ95337.1 CocE/NonD family hydrolase [Halobacillus shinanisalinarum]